MGINILKNFPETHLAVEHWEKHSIAPLPSQAVHHIIVRNCKKHNCGGSSASRCDYVTFENNIISNDSWYSCNAPSGFSILDPTSIDTVTGYKMIIRNNIFYNNKSLVKWVRTKQKESIN
jgi:hypothetical protein